jgi:hypothetical protein
MFTAPLRPISPGRRSGRDAYHSRTGTGALGGLHFKGFPPPWSHEDQDDAWFVPERDKGRWVSGYNGPSRITHQREK